MSDTTTDDVTKMRKRAQQFTSLVDMAYNTARILSEMKADGVSYEDVVTAVWSKLLPPHRDILPEAMLLEATYPAITVLCAFMEGEGTTEDRMKRVFGAAREAGDGAYDGVLSRLERMVDATAIQPANRMRTVIRRALAEAKSPLPDQTPAIECGITLVGGSLSFMGSLSETPDGGLRLLAPVPGHAAPGRTGAPVPMMEHFFHYHDVAVFSLMRSVTVETSSPRIITS